MGACGDDSSDAPSAGKGADSAGTGAGAANSAGKGAATAGSTAGSAGTAANGGGTMPTDTLVGSFNLRLVPAMEATSTVPAKAPQTSFVGGAANGATPVAKSWIAESEAAGCTLYTPKQPLCSPGCGATGVCVTDDNCVERPKAQDLGKIHLSGVGDGEVTMTAIAGNYQPPTGTALPYPPCAEGDMLKLVVDGGAYQSFTLNARCIAPVDFPGPIKLVKKAPLKLSWSAPGNKALARIQVHVDISHHGGARGKIDCEIEDTGSLEIPATMVDRLMELGIAGFPTVVVTRVATGGTASGEPSHVAFVVQNAVERAIEIEGLVSCNDNSQCTSGTCQSDRTCK